MASKGFIVIDFSMERVFLSTAYLAPVSYYIQLFRFPQIYVERYEYYKKQSYRNRCNIIGANGILPLSVPIIKPDSPNTPICDIRVSDHGNWQHLHWNAIISAYNSTPYFEYYQDDFAPFFEKVPAFLFDFNEQLRETVCELLDIHPQITCTDKYQSEFLPEDADFRDIIHPKQKHTDEVLNFVPAEYYQVFSRKFGFIANMSILDLLFNMGPESIFILKESISKNK